MRVNLEDSLITEGHLKKLARAMKWKERSVGGALWFVYRSTQKAGLVSATIDQFVTCIVLDFESDDEAVSFLNAMCAAQLAERTDDGKLRIVGNEKHVERLVEYKERASKGGKARQRQIAEKLNVGVADKQATSLPHAKLQASTPFSLLPSPFSIQETNTNTGSFSKQIELTEVVSAEFDSRRLSESAPRVSAKPKRSAAEQEAAKLVKDAFHAGYRKRYGRPITGWGVPHNAHIYHLLKIWPAHELATLAVAYFAWPRSGPIEAGHPFMGNPKSFSANLEALHADTFKADRRVEAAGIRQQDRDFDVRAANESTLDRVFTKLGAQENGKLEPATGSEQQRFTAAQTSNLFADGRAQSADVRGSDDALGQEVVTVCKGKGPLGGS